MNVAWGLLTVLSLVCHTESRCSPTSYYKNCWIRRFPGIFIDIEESQRRGAQLLKYYQEETALKCSRTCCLTRNFSCNLAIFHYETTHENVNCFHLHCPTLESCILSHRGNVVLYNITKGVDPDLLVFGKYFTSNVRVLPHHYSRVNASEPLPSDKRQFIHPPPPAALPLTSAPSVKPPTKAGGVHTTTAAATTTTAATTTITAAATAASATTADAATTISADATTTTTAAQQSTSQPTTASTTTAASPSTEETSPASENHEQTASATAATSLQPSFTTPPSSTTLANRPSTSTTFSGDIESSKHYPNDTKGILGRNHTAGSEGDGGEDTLAGFGPGWHVAAHTLLVAVSICITVLLSCCCSVLLVVSWRGQRKRMGRYRTSWRGKRGSMRLIKYVLVRESS
ncbi:MANSC domain-containing protein 4-like [Embiotoca jacksoni]|uniref:MANSC domain-containing protein 4-like n=1 Tax=Embiotoca jacksoni TaxID=100190 RepID=UPI0037049293